jgi:hypothetical protein
LNLLLVSGYSPWSSLAVLGYFFMLFGLGRRAMSEEKSFHYDPNRKDRVVWVWSGVQFEMERQGWVIDHSKEWKDMDREVYVPMVKGSEGDGNDD